MKDDLLQAATRALREESERSDDGRHTRARVMASLHQGKVKRRTRLAFALPLAACLAAGTAWGAATGRLPAVFHAIGRMVSYTREPVEPAPQRANAGEPATRAPSTPPAPRPSAIEPLPAPPAPGPALSTARPALPPPPVTPPAESEPTRTPPAASAAFSDRDGDLYRLAHEAHFESHDYARALAGWDAYLRAAPSGRLATEARFNRALCLLRLGRDEEAERALQPFATGVFGYRQTEARQLLEELSSDPKP